MRLILSVWYVIFGPGAYKNNNGKKSDVKTHLGFQKLNLVNIFNTLFFSHSKVLCHNMIFP